MKMDGIPEKYLLWIDKNYPTIDHCKDKCNEAVRRMTVEFPELQIRVGLANGTMHCWTVDEKNRIVDPTAKQFGSAIHYRAIANRFLKKHEYEPATGAVFLDS